MRRMQPIPRGMILIWEARSLPRGDALTIAGQAVVQFGTVLGNIYYTLGPALPLIVEKGFFYLAAGAVVTQVLAGAPDALRAIDQLANNVSSYNGQFSAGPGPRGIQVGRAAQQNLGDGFPVFDNFDPETGEGTQIYSHDSDSGPLSNSWPRFAPKPPSFSRASILRISSSEKIVLGTGW